MRQRHRDRHGRTRRPGDAGLATVGSLIVLRGGNDGSGGTWPGPAQISEAGVVRILSSHAAGTSFTAQLRAVTTGTTSVTVPFVAGNDVCDPTPCTPYPAPRCTLPSGSSAD